ncbi:btb (poz) domain-containing 2a-related [Anaeramoeba flamelloides]|uniref:Btb (Poz) domain-containing 2a-related n=1 Tax=Anaeramoeba flamelloides TaxID=1746091 RepID=A0AAV7YTH3_9EUKA|nr:btb (poz) domain-containing 2a-related [Anaeramoeba flamelloides]
MYHTYQTPIALSFADLVNSPKFSDITFYVGSSGKRMYGHQVFLAHSSKFFEKLLFPDDPNNSGKIIEIEIQDVDPSIFYLLLNFCYTGIVTLSQINSPTIFLLAKQFKIQKLIDLCLFFWKDHPSVGIQNRNKNNVPIRIETRNQNQTTNTNTNTNTKTNTNTNKNFNILRNQTQKENPPNSLHQKHLKSRGQNLNQNNAFTLNSFNKRDQQTHNQNNSNYQNRNKNLNFQSNHNLVTQIKNTKSKNQNSYNNQNQKKQFNVGILASDKEEECIQDVVRSINSGEFSCNIVVINTSYKSPVSSELRKYDALFVYSANSPFTNPKELGNNLNKYLNEGGGIVLCALNALELGGDNQLGGQITVPTILPINKQRVVKPPSDRQSLGSIWETAHPILKQVKSFDGGKNSLRIDVKKSNKCGRIIALWTDKTILIVENNHSAIHRFVILNFFPASNRINSECWDKNTDGDKIIANSIEYVARNSKVFKSQITNRLL